MPSYLISVQLPSSISAELNENKIGRLRTPEKPTQRESKAPKMVKKDKDSSIFHAICQLTRFIYQHTLCRTMIDLFVHSFIHSFIHSFTLLVK